MLKKLKLETKTVIVLASITIACLGIMTGIISYQVRDLACTEAYQKLHETANRYSLQVEAPLSEAMAAAKAYASSLSGAVSHPDKISRPIFYKSTESILASEDFYFGVWASIAPGKFDGDAQQLAGTEGIGDDGAFLVYAYREDGKIVLDTAAGTYEEELEEDYMSIPLSTKKESIMEPYVDEISGAFMTSVCMPISSGSEYIGVAGIDVVLSTLSDMVAAITPYDDGYAFLVSNEGNILGHPNKESLGKTIADLGFADSVQQTISTGQELTIKQDHNGKQYHIQFVPVKVGNASSTWSLAIAAPVDKIVKRADSLAMTMVIIGIISAMVLVVAVYIIVTRITRPITSVIGELAHGSVNVSTTSSHISHASQQLAQSAAEQAANLEEITSSLEMLASQSGSNAEGAGQADQLMTAVNDVIQKTSEAMNQTVATMDGIKESSDKVSGILKVIEEIAFQTNLLALNAAVEAARAGEHGKGFAVVAEEVRNLAMRSAQAAKDTEELIETSVQQANQGVKVVEKANSGITQISESAHTVSSNVALIASSSSNQAVGIEQIKIAITQLDSVVQNVASSAEESASASEEMSDQAQQLDRIAGGLTALIGKSNA